MRKFFLFVLLLVAFGSGAALAESPEAGDIAMAGMAADVGTTAVGLAMGAAEANPLGLAVIPLKFAVKNYIDSIQDQHERREALAQFTGVQFAAATANVCTLALASPIVAGLCFAAGLSLGYSHVRATPTSEETCVKRHLAQFEEGAATGRVYRVDLKTCTGRFDGGPIILAEATGASGAHVGSEAEPP